MLRDKQGRYVRIPTVDIPLGESPARAEGEDIELEQRGADSSTPDLGQSSDSWKLLRQPEGRSRTGRSKGKGHDGSDTSGYVEGTIRSADKWNGVKICMVFLVILIGTAFVVVQVTLLRRNSTMNSNNTASFRPANPATTVSSSKADAGSYTSHVWQNMLSSSRSSSSSSATTSSSSFPQSHGKTARVGPSWSLPPMLDTTTESSGRLFDINNDGILDVIVSFSANTPGGSANASVCNDLGFHPCDSAVMALDGRTGERLWLYPAEASIFAIACGLLDGNKDGVMDCLVSGRSSQLHLVDAKTGERIWSAHKHLKPFVVWNVYTPVVLRDIDGDGVKDVLVAHGGDVRAAPWQTCRRASELRFFSGSSGTPIGHPVTMPEHRETYMSPVLFKIPDHVDYGDNLIMFGTGGESVNGSLWAIRLKDLLLRAHKKDSEVSAWTWGDRQSEQDVSPGAIRLVTGIGRGVSVPPVIVEMTGDGYPDILVSVFDGTLMLLDGRTSAVVWKRERPGWEFYRSVINEIREIRQMYLAVPWPPLQGWWRRVGGERGCARSPINILLINYRNPQ